MATVQQRKPSVWEARAYVKPRGGEGVGRQVTKTFKGGKREVTRLIADWEREVQGAAAAGVGLTIEHLLDLWQEAKAAQWQPTTAREHKHRSAAIVADLGSVRVPDLDPMRVDAWVATGLPVGDLMGVDPQQGGAFGTSELNLRADRYVSTR